MKLMVWALAASAAIGWSNDAVADCATQHFIFAEQSVYLGDRVQVGRGSTASRMTTELGVSTLVQGDLIAPSITMRNNSVLNGSAYTSTAVNLSAGARILVRTASLGAGQACSSPTLPVVSPGLGEWTIDGSSQLPPGHYGDLTVSEGSTLAITSGDYHFASLVFEPDAHLVVLWQGGTARILSNSVSFGDRHDQLVTGTTSVASALEVISTQNAQLRLGTDSTIAARIMAPSAEVNVPSRTLVQAPLYGRIVRVEPDSTIGKPVAPLPTLCQ